MIVVVVEVEVVVVVAVIVIISIIIVIVALPCTGLRPRQGPAISPAGLGGGVI